MVAPSLGGQKDEAVYQSTGIDSHLIGIRATRQVSQLGAAASQEQHLSNKGEILQLHLPTSLHTAAYWAVQPAVLCDRSPEKTAWKVFCDKTEH